MSANNNIDLITPVPAASTQFNATTAAVTGDGTSYDIAFNTINFDTTGSFAAGNYTVPQTGKYYIKCDIYMGGLAAGHTLGELRIGKVGNYFYCVNNPGVMMTFNNRASIATAGIMNLTAGDVINANITVSNGALAVTMFGAAAVWYARLEIRYLNV